MNMKPLRGLLGVVALSQLSLHGFQGLSVDVVDKGNANKLANCAEGIQSGHQPAESAGGLSGLTDRTQSGNITDQRSAHEGNNGCGANTLGQLPEEGVQGVNNTFLSLSKLPLVVVNGITLIAQETQL